MTSSIKGKLVPLFLGLTCIILATTWIGWKEAYAGIGSYGAIAGAFQNPGPHSSNYIACDNSDIESSLLVTLAQGPNVTTINIGSSCETALNTMPSSCKVATETQQINGATLSTLFRIICR